MQSCLTAPSTIGAFTFGSIFVDKTPSGQVYSTQSRLWQKVVQTICVNCSDCPIEVDNLGQTQKQRMCDTTMQRHLKFCSIYVPARLSATFVRQPNWIFAEVVPFDAFPNCWIKLSQRVSNNDFQACLVSHIPNGSNDSSPGGVCIRKE